MHPNTSPRQTLPASNIFRGRRAGRFEAMTRQGAFKMIN